MSTHRTCPTCLAPVALNTEDYTLWNLDGSEHTQHTPPTITSVHVIHGTKGANDVLYALGSNGRAYYLYTEHENGRLTKTWWAPLPKLPPDEA